MDTALEHHERSRRGLLAFCLGGLLSVFMVGFFDIAYNVLAILGLQHLAHATWPRCEVYITVGVVGAILCRHAFNHR